MRRPTPDRPIPGWIAPALAAALFAAALLPAPVAAGEDAAGPKPCQSSTQECLDSMAQRMKDSGWVGVELESVEGQAGVVVRGVVTGSPAEGAGIRKDDVLIAINGIELGPSNEERIEADRKNWTPGAGVTWTMLRGDAKRELQITLGRMPADVLARYIGQHMLLHADLVAPDDEGDEG